MAHADDEWVGWKELREALLAMPSGTWTTYGDVAALIGTHAISVGNRVASTAGLHGAYRVLTADGRVSAGFRWPDDRQSGDPRALLEAEGIPFDKAGRASRSHRLTAADLAILLGKEASEEEPPAQELNDVQQASAARFEGQLRDNQTPQTVEGVLSALRFWEQQGGHSAYSKAGETSCFPTVETGTLFDSRTLWPMAFYPVTGTVEVVFQHLKRRPPFDDEPMRRELLARCNEIEGIELAEAKLDLRPSFPLEVFAAHGEELCAVLEWFIHQVALAEARRPFADAPARP